MSAARSYRSRTLPLFVAPLLIVASLALLLRDREEEKPLVLEQVGVTDSAITPAAGTIDLQALQLLEEGPGAVQRRTGTSPSEEIEDPPEAIAPEPRISRLFVSIEPSPWLQGIDPSVTFEWAPKAGRSRTESLSFHDGRPAPVHLEGVPQSADQFSKVLISGLQAKVLELREARGSDTTREMPNFELRVELQAGATVVWDDAVPAGARTPLSLALGAGVSPPSRDVWSLSRQGLTPSLEGIELPVVLPRLVREDTLWVGGAKLAWNAFPVGPDSKHVEVWTTAGVSIRVTHDLDPSRGEFHAWAMAHPTGDAERVNLKSRDPLLLGPRPPGTLEVWISDGDEHDSQRVTRTARFEAQAGETVEVDLTEAYGEQHLGQLRFEMAVPPQALGVSREEVSFALRRRTEEDPAKPWSSAGQLEPLDPTPEGAWTYEAKGIEPGEYRVQVSPFAGRIPIRIEAGDRLQRTFSTDGIGWIETMHPEERSGRARLSLGTAEADPRERSYYFLGRRESDEGRTLWPVLPGRYAVRDYRVGRKGGTFESPPFHVTSGQVVGVELFERTTWEVAVRAKEANSGEPISLDLDFWLEVRAIDTTNGLHHRGSTGFHGGHTVPNGCDWTFDAIESPVRIEIPEHPHWSFEELEPLLLEDGITIEILGRRKVG